MSKYIIKNVRTGRFFKIETQGLKLLEICSDNVIRRNA